MTPSSKKKVGSPHPRIGILGGGQLGKMLTQAAMNFDLHLSIMDSSPDAPCEPYCHNFVLGDLNDFDAVYEFGRQVELLTIEIENVNVPALKKLEDEGILVSPSPEIIGVIQDKGNQKEFLRKHGIPTAGFVYLDGAGDLKDFKAFFPAIQKLRREGYDGRGVQRIDSPADLAKGFTRPSIIEELVDIHKELSVIVARSRTGEMKVYPSVEMVFHEANLIDYLVAPADIPEEVEREAEDLAVAVADKLGIVGLAAVEMFVSKDGRVLVNEIAPRPHNSGHHTIDANVTSQYEQHLRAIIGLPLGSTDIITPAVMVNLIGEPGYDGPVVYEGLNETLAVPGAKIHIYGKNTTKPHRKMGHVTILAPTREEAIHKARFVRDILKVKTG
jgi:5-(carboxyamino)imidazole ribonucleotide synthase